MAKIRANIYDKAYVPSLGRGPFMNKVIHEELFRSLKRLGYVVEDADAEVSDRLVFEEVDEGFLIDGVAGPAPVSVETFYKLTNSSDAPEVPANAYRNFAQSSTSEWSNAYTDFNGNENQLINISKVLTDGMHVGDTLKARVVVKYDNIVPVEGKTVEICMQGDGNVTEWGNGGFPHTEPKTLSGSGEIVLECTETLTSEHLKNGWWNWQFRVDYVASGSIQYKENKVEIGQDFTPYTPAPEQLGWSTATLVPTQSQRYLWKFEYVHYSDGSIKITQPTILSIVGASTPQQPEPPKDETVVSPEPPKGDGDSSPSNGQQPPLGDTDSGTELPPQNDGSESEEHPKDEAGTEQQPPQVGGNENTEQQPSVGDGDSVQTPNTDVPKVDENEAPKEDAAETQVGEDEAPKVETTEAPKADTVEEAKVDAEDKKAVENKVQLTDDEVKFLTSNAKRQEIIDLLTEKGVHIENENATIAELLNLVGLTRN